MGQEAQCLARIGERVVEVKALLETDELILRGEHRARLPFAGLDSVEAADGCLTLRQGDEPIVLELGAAAERWASKIRNPPTLLDKLGVKSGQRIAAIGLTDQDLRSKLQGCTSLIEPAADSPATLADELSDAELDLIFVQVEDRQDFGILPIAAQAIVQSGAVWVVHPKRRPDLKDTDVMAAGKQAGLIDNKVARISETHSALRFVIPTANRRPSLASKR